MDPFQEDEDDFFDDPELHAQLDQVENQFIINSQLINNSNLTNNDNFTNNTSLNNHQPAQKKPKLNHPVTPNNNTNTNNNPRPLHQHNLNYYPSDQNQETIERLKHQIQEINKALKQSDSDRTRLKGEVSVIRSKLESHQTQSTKQLQDLHQAEIQSRLKAEQAQKELLRFKAQNDLKDTFKGLQHQSSKKSHLIQPSSISSKSKNLPSTTTHPSKFHAPQDLLFNHHAHQNTFNHLSTSKKSFNLPSQSNDHSPSKFQHPPDKFVQSTPLDRHQQDPSHTLEIPSSSPLFPSSYTNALHHPNRLLSQIDNLQIHPPSARSHTHRNKLISLMIVYLFQSFVVNINHRADHKREINPISSLQTILNASLHLQEPAPSASDSLQKKLDKLILDLFLCLSGAFQEDVQTSRPAKTKLRIDSSMMSQNDHQQIVEDEEDANHDDPFVMNFVAELGAIFIQIADLLSQTDLLEAQASSIQIMNILAQSSPLFGSYFLLHPDFKDLSPSTIFPGNYGHPSSPIGQFLRVLVTYFTQVTAFFEQVHDRLELKLPEERCSKQTDGMFLIHLALLDLLESIVWDPPEVCYPTLVNFLESNQVLKFLLIENQPGITLEKSLHVVISLASKTELSKIILTSRIQVMENQNRSPSNSNLNSMGNQSLQQSVGNKTRTTRSKTIVENPAEERKKRESSEEVSLVERLMKILIFTLSHQINAYQYPSCPSNQSDGIREQNKSHTFPSKSLNDDYHQIKVNILTLLNLLGIKNSTVHHSNPGDHQLAPINGFHFIFQSSKIFLSILIKLVFMDSYLLWNLDGSIFHKLQIPKCIERIELAIEILSKVVFSNHEGEEQERRSRLNLMERLMQEATELSALKLASSAKMMLIGPTNLYHEFILSFSKLSFSDLHHPSAAPAASSASATLDLQGVLNKDQIIKFDNIGDLAYDLLQSVSSMDELNDWRLCSIDDDEEEDEDDEIP